MCGRFSLSANEAELNLRFELEGGEAPYVPRYNGAPTQMLAVITGEKPHRLSYHRWGLIPPWAKDISIGNKMINARAETITEKASFRTPLFSKRCLVPADGFYEWQQDTGKQPYRILEKWSFGKPPQQWAILLSSPKHALFRESICARPSIAHPLNSNRVHENCRLP